MKPDPRSPSPRPFRQLLAAAFLVALGAGLPAGLPAQDKGKAGGTEKFAVVRVGEEVRVVAEGELGKLRADLAKQHKEAMARYREAKKAAAKTGKKLEEQKPKAVALKVVAKGLPTREAAEERAKGKAAGGGKHKYAVVKVGEDVRVVSDDLVKSLQRQVAADHKAALKSWTHRKAEAKKAGKPFDEPRPVQAKVEIVKGGFATRAEAEQHRGKTAGHGTGG